MKKQRSASPSQAMPSSAPSDEHLVDDEPAVLLEQRVGLVVGELAVGRPVGLDLVDRQLVEQRAAHRARHPVAAVEHDLQRRHRGRIDEGERVAPGRARRRPRCSTAPGSPAGSPGSPPVTRSRSSPMPGVAGQRERAAPDQLGAGVGLRVVRGRAHQAAVELARADGPVEHLGAHHPDVEHRRALVAHARARSARPAPGAVRRMSRPSASRSSLGSVSYIAGQHAREAAPDAVGHVLVDLLAVEAADVVGLEDSCVYLGHAAGGYSQPRRRK